MSAIDVLYCEDTRVSGNLLHKLSIEKPLFRYDEHVEQKLIPEIIEHLKSGQKIGLISDAGVPTLSDPGFKLVRECVKNGIKIVNIPGPSAILTALSVSGLPTDHFMFFGFLPKTETHVNQIFQKMEQITRVQKTTFIFFESPFRIIKSLNVLAKLCPQARIAVCRELTKVHEEIIRGTVDEVLKNLSSRSSIRGEITVVLSFNF